MGMVDPQAVNQSRLELEEDIEDKVRRCGERVVKVPWWNGLGLSGEPTLDWIVEKKVVCKDGVHLEKNACSLSAVALYHRMTEGEMGDLGVKRRKFSC